MVTVIEGQAAKRRSLPEFTHWEKCDPNPPVSDQRKCHHLTKDLERRCQCGSRLCESFRGG